MVQSVEVHEACVCIDWVVHARTRLVQGPRFYRMQAIGRLAARRCLAAVTAPAVRVAAPVRGKHVEARLEEMGEWWRELNTVAWIQRVPKLPNLVFAQVRVKLMG